MYEKGTREHKFKLWERKNQENVVVEVRNFSNQREKVQLKTTIKSKKKYDYEVKIQFEFANRVRKTINC